MSWMDRGVPADSCVQTRLAVFEGLEEFWDPGDGVGGVDCGTGVHVVK
jgi:hypothetical protein